MNTSIKQIMEIVMAAMIKIMEKVLNGDMNFFEISEKVKEPADKSGGAKPLFL